MKALSTAIPGVILVEPDVFGDDRGFFLESFNERKFRDLRIDAHFVQDNHSRSRQGVLRGLHYQIEQPQGKLVRAARGRVFDVCVDLRRNSPAFGKWVGVELSEENKRLLWIPPGLAHGFLVLSDFADFLYKTSEYYAPESERTILWNDPELNIQWPLVEEPVLSAKDSRGIPFQQAEVYEDL